MFRYSCFCLFLSSVCWFLSDGRFRRAERFVLFFGAMVEAGFVQSLTGRRGAEPIGCS